MADILALVETLESIREAILARRKLLGIRQGALARMAQVSLATLKGLEQGRAREMGFQKLTRILAALGMELRLHEANRGRPTLEDLREEPDEPDDFVEPEVDEGRR